MRFLSLLLLAAPFFAVATGLECRVWLQNFLPSPSNPEFLRMKEYLKGFIAEQVEAMPTRQQKRVMGVLKNETHLLHDKYLYSSYFQAAVDPELTLGGLKLTTVFFEKFSSHPAIGLQFAHEFAHLTDYVRGNPHVDAARYIKSEYFAKNSVIKREEVAARAEYKYLRGLYTKADLERMEKNYDHQKQMELRKKFLSMRRKLRADPRGAYIQHSREELNAYLEWVMMRLDYKFIQSIRKALSMSEEDYVTDWSRQYYYRSSNRQHNFRIDRNRFIAGAATALGTLGAAALAEAFLDAENDDEKEEERAAP